MPIPQCSKHRPHPTWTSATGPRCPVCGAGLDDQAVPDEPPVVRSFAFYQQRAGLTSGQHGTRTPSRLCMAVAGLCGEAGEFLDAVKKRDFHGHWNVDAAAKELGDCLWYIAETATSLGLELDVLAGASLERPWQPLVAETAACSPTLAAALELVERAAATMMVVALAGFEPRPEGAAVGSPRTLLGETLYALARAASACGVDLEQVATANAAKLWLRYKHRFTAAASVARVDVAAPADAAP